MLVIAHHIINDPEGFWAAAEEATKSLPANLKVQGIYPSQDAKLGTCLWDADSAQAVQQFLDQHAGQYAKNVCYEVNVEKSLGLPDIKLAAASLS
jgi:hypothetical protein